jgi:hypothetical protein
MRPDRIMEAVGLIGFLVTAYFILPGVILHDVARHQPQPSPAPADLGAMTAHGVPYVPGPTTTRG